MPLMLALSLLAADPPVEEASSHARDAGYFALVATAGLLSAAAAVCGWPARETGLGRACAITGGAFGGAALGGLAGYGITALQYGSEASLEKQLSATLGAVIGALVGLGAGALASVFASGPPGTSRGVLAIAGGGLGFVGATFTFVYQWND